MQGCGHMDLFVIYIYIHPKQLTNETGNALKL